MPKISESVSARLISIFAERGKPLPRHGDDSVAIELLRFLYQLAAKESLNVPTLELYFSRRYPEINLRGRIQQILCNHKNLPYKNISDLAECSDAEYKELCLDLLPRIVYETWPVPADTVDPYRNLFASWAVELGDKIRKEIWCGSVEIRKVGRIVRDYMDMGVYSWPESLAVWFFKTWNEFLLTDEWPYEKEFAELQDYSNALEIVNAHQAKRILELKRNGEVRYINLTAAARVLMTAVYGNTEVKTETNTLAKRVKRKCATLQPIPGKQGANFYLLQEVLPIFCAEKELRMTEDRIRGLLTDVSVLESAIDPDKARTM